ncbi:MAG: DinB family protein [Actinomycetota bacterium]|nr:DinB family protein [Actinomycetota bacterium]
MANEWRDAVIGQLDWYWSKVFRPRLASMEDEEYLWEPVEGCWTVRPDAGGRTVIDWQFPEPEPAPVTTIAWRLCHLGTTLAQRARFHFGDPAMDEGATFLPLTSGDGVAFVEEGFEAWRSGIEAWRSGVEEAESNAPSTTPHDMAAVLVHMNREVIHHAAEVALLRDLYRHSAGRA